MTTQLEAETAAKPSAAGGIDIERLCVAARSVLERMPDLHTEGLGGATLENVTRHAQALVDLQGLRALPFGALRAHAVAVRDALTLLAGDRSLTLAVWFEDALGAR